MSGKPDQKKNDTTQRDNQPSTPGLPGGGARMAMAAPAEKPKDLKGTLKRLMTYILPHYLKLLLVLLSAIAGTLFAVFSPKILGQVTTIIFSAVVSRMQGDFIPFDYGRIGQILVLLVGLYTFSAFFSFLETFVMSDVAQRIVFDLRNDARSKLTRLPLKYFDAHQSGETLSRLTNDIDTIAGTLQQSLAKFITSAVMVTGIIILMLTISPLMTLIMLVSIPLTTVVTARIAKRSQKNFARQQRELGILNGHIEEMYSGHTIVKSFGNEAKSLRQFQKINNNLYEQGWRSQFVAGLIMPLIGFINNIGYILICVFGAVFVARGSITIGNVQAFIQYSKQFTQPILQFANIANIIQSAIAAAERVFELMDEEEQQADYASALKSFKPQGDVRFDHVRFSYRNDISLIRDLSINISAGETVAIVGPTGAGKTTLVNLLMRFYEIDDGRITLDGNDICDIERSAVRNCFGMVLQDTWLFKGSIRDNIAYGRENATDEEIMNAARISYADHFIRTLPDGYDTILNEEASNISQGQKQLLTIARAVLADPVIMILDEATSSVDTRTELLIQKAMQELMKGRTSFIIAHRLSTIHEADTILVMNEGDVVETGTHNQLLSRGGLYANLYKS